MMNKLLSILSILFFLLSCETNDDNISTKIISSTISSSNTNEEQKAEITFSEEAKEFNFGEIVEGEKVYHTFEFTNTSSVPLIISGAEGSCGCTVPESYTKSPILPGNKGTIDVVFDSEGRPGTLTKSIRIFSNTYPSETLVYLKGVVISPN